MYVLIFLDTVIMNKKSEKNIQNYMKSLVPEPAKSTFYDFEKSVKNVYQLFKYEKKGNKYPYMFLIEGKFFP